VGIDLGAGALVFDDFDFFDGILFEPAGAAFELGVRAGVSVVVVRGVFAAAAPFGTGLVRAAVGVLY
jgi:hypothetical protein